MSDNLSPSDVSQICFRHINCEYGSIIEPGQPNRPCHFCGKDLTDLHVFLTHLDCQLVSHLECANKYIQSEVAFHNPTAKCPKCSNPIGEYVDDVSTPGYTFPSLSAFPHVTAQSFDTEPIVKGDVLPDEMNQALMNDSTIKFIPWHRVPQHTSKWSLHDRRLLAQFETLVGKPPDLLTGGISFQEAPIDPANPGVFLGFEFAHTGCIEIDTLPWTNPWNGKITNRKVLVPMSAELIKITLDRLYEEGWDPKTGKLARHRILRQQDFLPLSTLVEDLVENSVTDISSIDLARLYGRKIDEYYALLQIPIDLNATRLRRQRLHICLEYVNPFVRGPDVQIRALASRTGYSKNSSLVPPWKEQGPNEADFTESLVKSLGVPTNQLRRIRQVLPGNYVEEYYRAFEEFGYNRGPSNRPLSYPRTIWEHTRFIPIDPSLTMGPPSFQTSVLAPTNPNLFRTGMAPPSLPITDMAPLNPFLDDVARPRVPASGQTPDQATAPESILGPDLGPDPAPSPSAVPTRNVFDEEFEAMESEGL